MTRIHIFAGLFALAAFYYYRKGRNLPDPSSPRAPLVLMILGLVLRMGFAATSTGFTTDTACFAAWAARVFEGGFGNFYSPDVFTDYPPGFIYILYPIGALLSWLKLDYLSGPYLLLLRLPAILCDMGTAWLIFKLADKKSPRAQSLFLTGLYLFNPAVVLNSSVWGQVDAVFTLPLLFMCLYLTEGRTVRAYGCFALGVLLKPQMLVFTPVLLYGIADQVLLKDCTRQKFLRNLFWGLGMILAMVLLCVPFGLDRVLAQYTTTLGSYPYVAVNAFNFWGFFGLNWVSQTEMLGFMSYAGWGTVIILCIVLLSAILFFKGRDREDRYFSTAAFLIVSMFLFSVRMHERYLFPAMALLLCAYAIRPLRSSYLCYSAFTVLHYYNTAYILRFYDPQNYDRKAPLFLAVSAAMVFCGAYYYYKLYLCNVSSREIGRSEFFAPGQEESAGRKGFGKETSSQKASGGVSYGGSAPRRSSKGASGRSLGAGTSLPLPSEKPLPVSRTDLFIIGALVVLYSGFALYDLGDRQAPQSVYTCRQGESITLDLGEGVQASSLNWFLGSLERRDFSLEYRNSQDEEWINAYPETEPGQGAGHLTMNSVFAWAKTSLPAPARYVRLTCQSDQAYLMELVLTDPAGNPLLPVNAGEYGALFDEQSLFPDAFSFRNSTYFDEIYHARTAYEFLHGLPTYETTHPPFGKILIALGVALFGMTPFGWRIAGTVFGILMLPLIYLTGRDLTKNRWMGGLAGLIFAFDFMHFAQTRIATIDVYVTFFIILMYFFMYRYLRLSFYDTPLKKTFVPLGACGVAMGFGIASKWTGVYAGAGLGVLFFLQLWQRYREYLYAKANPKGSTGGISHRQILQSFAPCVRKTIRFCLVFFVAVPFCIYLLSYIPFVGGQTGLFSKMWHNQQYMLNYHSNLNATHDFSSTWSQWPTMIRPIFYYSGIIGEQSEGLRQGISAFGNPLVWWVGIPVFVYMVYLALKKKDRPAILLCISYLAQYLPWTLVPRLTFIYHYFPSVPFVVLMIMYAAFRLWQSEAVQKSKGRKRAVLAGLCVYCAAVVGLFLLFYPVLAGQTVTTEYVDKYLRWMESWVLIYG